MRPERLVAWWSEPAQLGLAYRMDIDADRLTTVLLPDYGDADGVDGGKSSGATELSER